MLQSSSMYVYLPANDVARAAARFKDPEGNSLAIIQEARR